MSLDLVEGWTDPIDEQLLADGVPVDLTGLSVALVLKGRTGTLVDTTGKTSITDAATGRVRFSPASTDLVAAQSPYTRRWKVTDGSLKVAFFPNAVAGRWTVRLS